MFAQAPVTLMWPGLERGRDDFLKRAAQRAEARGMETTACKPHGVAGDCGTCRLLEDLEKLRAFSLRYLEPRETVLMSASNH